MRKGQKPWVSSEVGRGLQGLVVLACKISEWINFGFSLGE